MVVPQQGSWHSAANSSFMNGCPNPQACRDDDDEAQVGEGLGGLGGGKEASSHTEAVRRRAR